MSLFLLLALCLGHSQTSAPTRILDTRALDLDGRLHRLGMEPGPAPVALVFLEVDCPASRRYVPRLNELARLARERGIGFFGVLSDPSLSIGTASSFRAEYELSFPLLFDSAGDLAERLLPTTVPEAFVIGAEDELLYRGRIDDLFVAPSRTRSAVTSEELRAALLAAGNGQRPATSFAAPVGCAFEAWLDPAAVPVTFGRHVAPILRAQCLDCHRSGDIAPFALRDYEDARRRARMIAQVTEDRIMPPWHAGPSSVPLQNERVLSARQVAVLRAWAEAGAPRGESEDALPALPESPTHWRMGEPDLSVSMPVEYSLAADGDDVYRYFVVENPLTEARNIGAYDFRPGDPAVVHHCIAYLDHTGRARALDALDQEPGFSVFGANADFLAQHAIAGWAPGGEAYRFPAGVAMQLPPGGDFVLEVHYHKNGKATSDRSTLALYDAEEPVERLATTLVMGTEQIDIAPDDARYERRVWMELPEDFELFDLSPHMHYLGQEVEVLAELPDGEELTLLAVPRWDFRWQDTYFYRRPLLLPQGSRLEARFRFDNSAANPANPSVPPMRVQEGWRTTDEMCLLYLTGVAFDPEHEQALQWAAIQSFLRPAGNPPSTPVR